MKLVTFLQSSEQLVEFSKLNIQEVIIAPCLLSRFGTLSIDQCQLLAKDCGTYGIRPILLWDILMTQQQFAQALDSLLPLIAYFDCIRVYDPGAIHYLLAQHQHQLQVMLELGSHNLTSLVQWQKIVGTRLDRLIPSYEIDQENLTKYSQQLNCPIEVFGLGRLPLSYTARQLLAPHYPKPMNTEHFEVLASSEESSHANMPVLQNRHGTFTFYMKDFCLVDFIPYLQQIGINSFMVDLRFLPIDQELTIIKTISQLLVHFSAEQFDHFKQLYSRPVFRGFFVRNKSDSVFSKLKNKDRDRNEGKVLAEVVDVAKGRYMGALVTHVDGIALGQQILVRTPEGKIKKTVIHSLFDSSYTAISFAVKGQLIYLPHLGGVSTKTLFFAQDNSDLP